MRRNGMVCRQAHPHTFQPYQPLAALLPKLHPPVEVCGATFSHPALV